MDPDEALKRLRELQAEITKMYDLLPGVITANDQYKLLDISQKATELTLQFQVLDEWLTKGGFKPTDWEK